MYNGRRHEISTDGIRRIGEMSEKERKAMIIANNVLYLSDNSDYETALWEILALFIDDNEMMELDYIDE